jgi:formate hydrogenlyase subunit 3/multisubunit Na+/H+ antiporter MnhD subunit
VLSTLFLIVALATLAMPGSANFAGEFLILLGLFNTKLVIALIASIGVALASVYMLRAFIRACTTGVGAGVKSFDLSVRDGLVLVPLVLVILAFAVYPQQALEHSRGDGGARGGRPGRRRRRPGGGGTVRTVFFAAEKVSGPGDRLAGDLAADRARGRRVRRADDRADARAVRAPDARAAGSRCDPRRHGRASRSRPGATTSASSRTDGDGRPHAVLTLLFLAAAAGAVLLAWRGIAPREAGHGEFHALLLTVVLGMGGARGATNLVTVFIGYELLSIPLYVLCATEMRRATSLESGSST